jgi:serine/threonine-protein kinase
MLPKYAPGEKIPGTPYVVAHRIGRGGMGDVLAVRDEHLDIVRAIKLLDLEPRPGQKRSEAVTEVLKEAVIIAKLHKLCREHIVEVLFVGQTADANEIPYIVMELIDGAPLRDLLKRRGGKLEPVHARQVGVDVLAALAAAHDLGIVHRDLKPANIMCEMLDQNRVRMKVIDFGITGGVNQRTKRIAGTFRYAAPEQIHISGPSPLMAQTDLYALGCILYECLAGQGPFDSYCRTNEHFVHAHLTAQPPLISTLVPGIPKAFDNFFASILAKDPALRPPTARACAAQLMDLPWDFSGDVDVTKTEEMLEAAIQSVVAKHEQNRAGVEAPRNGSTARSPGQIDPALAPTGTAQPINAAQASNASPRGGTLRVEGMAYEPPPEIRNAETRTSSPAVPRAQFQSTLPLDGSFVPPPAWGAHGNETRDPSTFGAVQHSFDLHSISPSARRFAAVAIGIAIASLCVTLGVWLAHRRAASTSLAQASASATSSAFASSSSLVAGSDSSNLPTAAPTVSVLAPIDSANPAVIASATASASTNPVPPTATSVAASAPDHPRVTASPRSSHAAHGSDSNANSPANSAGNSATIATPPTSAAPKPRKLPGSGL